MRTFRRRQLGYWWVPIAAAAAGSAVSGMFNQESAEKNQDWQQMMSGTAHQREVADLRAAGLNPILSATGGRGASTPGGAQATMPDLGGVVASAASVRLMDAQTKAAEAQARKTAAEADSAEQAADATRPGTQRELPDFEFDAQTGEISRVNVTAPHTRAQAAYVAGLSTTTYEARVRAVAAAIAEQTGMSTAKAHQRVQELLGDLHRMTERERETKVFMNEWELNFLKQYGLVERGIKLLPGVSGAASTLFRAFRGR